MIGLRPDDPALIAPSGDWVLSLDDDARLAAVHESLLALADGHLGTRGMREEDGPGPVAAVLASGVYEVRDGVEQLLEGPSWFRFDRVHDGRPSRSRRVLDLRRGLLWRELVVGDDMVTIVRFASLARPGVMVLRAEGPSAVLEPGAALRAPLSTPGPDDGSVVTVTSDLGGGITAAARQHPVSSAGRSRVERIAAFVADADRVPAVAEATAALDDADGAGFERLLAEHTDAWNRRWAEADIVIDGDPQIQSDVRYALFHLMASVGDDGEAPVGPRGLSGPAYSGHVFWDADVFVLPFLAATHPQSARAMLAYRAARLDAAHQEAAVNGYAGAQFPWESASSGREVAPKSGLRPDGEIVPIRTGDNEEHISADIAWAAHEYVAWTGDDAFGDGDGRRLVTDTARFWATRVRRDHKGRAHLYRVIGPDEYHEVVDDNAYTNVMARWNLRHAAILARRHGDHPDADAWDDLADRLVDGHDPDTGIYEQCAGFYGLQPLLIGDIATPPVAADLLLGLQAIRRTQIIKQPDVLMLHHLVPEETAPGSLEANLDFYLPRTAHGSSLSPAIGASLLARAGRPGEALDLLRVASRLDLDDLTGTTASGLHLAAMGGVWQAIVYGFAGIRPRDGALAVDPCLPPSWRGLTVNLRFRGAALRVAMSHHDIDLTTTAPLDVELAGHRHHLEPGSARFPLRHDSHGRKTP